MIRELIHDPLFLGIKGEDATINDLLVCTDLLDTITARIIQHEIDHLNGILI